MRTSRSGLRVLLIACAMTVAPSVGFSQGGPEASPVLEGQAEPANVDATTVTARAQAILADIQSRKSNTTNQNAKTCLDDKKEKVEKLKGQVAGSTELPSLLANLNEVAGELDACTGENAKTPTGAQGDTQVQMTVSEGTPTGEESNPAVIIPVGPMAGGPGLIGGTGVGENPGAGPGSDPSVVAVPPPISPTM